MRTRAAGGGVCHGVHDARTSPGRTPAPRGSRACVRTSRVGPRPRSPARAAAAVALAVTGIALAWSAEAHAVAPYAGVSGILGDDDHGPGSGIVAGLEFAEGSWIHPWGAFALGVVRSGERPRHMTTVLVGFRVSPAPRGLRSRPYLAYGIGYATPEPDTDPFLPVGGEIAIGVGLGEGRRRGYLEAAYSSSGVWRNFILLRAGLQLY